MTIVANMATYPPREAGMLETVARLAPQVDRLNVVLNEYPAEIDALAAYPNVAQILPEADTKDTGKFYPDVSGADYVLTVDDDLLFPEDFVTRTLELFAPYGRGYVAAHHGSLYRRPRFSLVPRKFREWKGYSEERIADYRRVYNFYSARRHPVVVDQLATNALIMHASDFPPFDFMKSSQKFVDVRLARWCFERGIVPFVLPKEKNWIRPVRYEDTIYDGFTRTNPPEVSREIMTYAYRTPGRGRAPHKPGGA